MSRRIEKARRQLLDREVRRLEPAHQGRLRVVVAYPNHYAVGMANLGFHVVLEQLLGLGGILVDRCFLPDERLLEQHRRSGTPLSGMETGRPLGAFDLILFSVSFEPDYVGMVTMLELGRIEPLAARRDRGPLVAAGGMALTINPEPVAALCDLVGVGEAETLVSPLLERMLDGESREQLLGSPSPGWYVPAAGPHPVSRQSAPLDRPGMPVVISPDASFAGHCDLEVSRGCRWRCRFCAAGHVVTPYRELAVPPLADGLEWAVQKRGRVGLVGTDVSDHSQLEEIAQYVWKLGGELALPSLRVESVARRDSPASRLLRQQPPRTLALGVEASCASLRHGLGKRLSDEKLLRAAALVAEAGVRQLKVYLLVGIPGETWEELLGVLSLAEELASAGPGGRLTLSVNGLVPKPGTPLQWEPAPSSEYLRRARAALRRGLSGDRFELAFESPDWTRWQSLLSLGGREVTDYLLLAAREGWRRALARAEKEVPILAGVGRSPSDALPWDHVSRGPEPDVLSEELERFRRREYVPPTRI